MSTHPDRNERRYAKSYLTEPDPAAAVPPFYGLERIPIYNMKPTADQIERAAKAYYDHHFDTDRGEGAEYGPYDEPWEKAPTSYRKDVRLMIEKVLLAALGES